MPPRNRDCSPPPHPTVVRVYTVCDESRYLIVRNVPALGCGDDLFKLFASYGDVEECKPMDAEDCEQFTDVYWIKFRLISNARFAKRKLEESIFLGNPLQVSYAPRFETVSDTKDKLEGRRKEVFARLNREFSVSLEEPRVPKFTTLALRARLHCLHHRATTFSQHLNSNQSWDSGESQNVHQIGDPPITRVSSDQDYFPSQSMNQTVRLVREKLNKIQSSSEHLQAGPVSKKTRVDNRRRI
ncbi:RNA-binding protein 48-like isoform X1 [Populus alba x Populus x berolinensis]|uniref:RNA-binding protein 48 n=1 Tax=Populus alba x Populus x berolinensis TaxID=444605 RepID=A0AAD6MJA3_9ROSI|nr:RNA-binding protein 48-like isoform X1 [Populus alba x Populus x berolinensis]